MNSTFPPPWARENVLLLIVSGIQSVSMGPQENLPPFPPFRPLPCFPAFPASPASLLPYFPACTVPRFSLLSLLSVLSLLLCFPCFPSFYIAMSLLFSVHCLCLVLVFPVRFRCFSLFCFASLSCLSLEVWSTARKGTAKAKAQKDALRGGLLREGLKK